jgi:FMN phosphatase YigB (HAD superfamily)
MVSTVIFDLDNTLINRKMAFQSYTERFVDDLFIYQMKINLRK